jgi:translation initiation factor IF-2
MGAYKVATDSGHAVTFLDTPGHEAFTEMRARGADVTDIVILVVAADDGVMPQTIEAINHAKAADVPIVVAVNKIDKPEAQVDRVKRQLTNYGLVPEEWGGDVIVVPVSAITGEGIDSLVEMVALQAEIMELEAAPDRAAIGTVLEARRTEGRGIVATLLVQKGTLHLGDMVVAGGAHGRVRIMTDERGREIGEAGPSVPVEISGLDEVPEAGDRFYVLDDLQKARNIASARAEDRRVESRATRQRVSMENLFETMLETGTQELRVVLKADVQGTLEVLTRTLTDLSVPEIKVNVIHSGVGSINDSDVLLADASEAVIVGFNVVVDASARAAAERSLIDVRTYNVIYRVIEDMKAALENRLAPEIREVVSGHAEVRDLFKISRIGTIAGCRVTDGLIRRRARLRVARQGAVIYEGDIESLRHFKEDVREVREGFECGIKVAGFDDVKVGDIIEAFETEEVRRTLS